MSNFALGYKNNRWVTIYSEFQVKGWIKTLEGEKEKKNRELFGNGECVVLFGNLNRSKVLIRGKVDEMGSWIMSLKIK